MRGIKVGNERMTNIERCFCNIYYILCIIAVITLIGWCYYDFQKDEDTSITTVEEFELSKGEHYNANMYPAATLCFGNPFLLLTETKLKEEYNLTINPNTFVTIYKDFLKGAQWDEIVDNFGNDTLDTFKKINYDDVTMNLESYMVCVMLILFSDITMKII